MKTMKSEKEKLQANYPGIWIQAFPITNPLRRLQLDISCKEFEEQIAILKLSIFQIQSKKFKPTTD